MFLAALLLAAPASVVASFGSAVVYTDLMNPLGAAPSSPTTSSALYTKTTFSTSTYPDAKCLDGGPGAVYVRPSVTPAGATKVKIFFQGGGWCTSDSDCYGRSKTDLGSTASLPATAADPAGYCGASFLSQDPALNKATFDFTSVYVPYCSGDSWTGSTLAPAEINSTASVWYRGAYLRDALIGTLASQFNLAAATEVAIGGCSAGGLTIYLNIDYLAAKVKAVAPAAKIRALADAGWFLDHLSAAGQPFRTPLFQWGFNAWNASAALSPACLAAFPVDQQWRCIFAQYTAAFIKTPTFMLNSRFDTCQLNGCELSLPDANKPWSQMAPSSRAAASAYSQDFDASLAASPFFSSSTVGHGGWVSSCLVHCDAGDGAWSHTLAAPRVGNGAPLTPSQAFEAWYYSSGEVGDGWWSDRSITPNMTTTC